jgi:hypothetical protein
VLGCQTWCTPACFIINKKKEKQQDGVGKMKKTIIFCSIIGFICLLIIGWCVFALNSSYYYVDNYGLFEDTAVVALAIMIISQLPPLYFLFKTLLIFPERLETNQIIPACASIVILIVVAVVDMDSKNYGSFYMLVRMIVCLSSLYYVFLSYKHKSYFWFYFFIFMALLFNFIIPLHFSYSVRSKLVPTHIYSKELYETWQFNIGAAISCVLFLFYSKCIAKKRNRNSKIKT